MNIIVFLGGDFQSPIEGIEQYLPQYVSKYAHVYCFEYPRFKKLFSLLSGRLPVIDKISPSLTVYHSFGILPCWRMFKSLNALNYRFNMFIFNFLFKKYVSGAKIITFTPEIAYIKDFFPSNDIFYYVIDDYALTFWKNPMQRKLFNHLESQTIKIAKMIVINSLSLLDTYRDIHTLIKYFPPPAKLEYYFDSPSKMKVPEDLYNIPKPIVGFAGTMSKLRIDTKLLDILLSEYPDVSFVFIGNVIADNTYFDILTQRKNFYLLDIKSLEELPPYIAACKVCIIPYNMEIFGKTSYPVKVNEYLALGKPVVTTALPAIKDLGDKGLIYWSNNDNEFCKFIRIALEENNNASLVRRRIREARKNDWQKRIKRFLNIMNVS